MSSKTRRRGLGRGLDSLLGAEPPAQPQEAQSAPAGPKRLAIDQLQPNRFQPRHDFDPQGLEELSESIRAQGVVQPIVVTPEQGGKHTIIAGERRWRASRMAGLDAVPVVLLQVENDQQLLELALVENLQRADLNPVEEAEAYRSLADSFGLSQEAIAERVGKGRTTVTNTLRLLRLPKEVQDLLRSGQLSAGQARPLLALADRQAQVELAQIAVEKGLTARQLESIAQRQEAPASKPEGPVDLDVHTRAALDRLTRHLQTKVEISRKRRGGILRIHFHSEEELIRLYDRLTQQEGDD